MAQAVPTCSSLARENIALTSFSPSPRNLEVSVDEEILKKVALLSLATARASIVLPLPARYKVAVSTCYDIHLQQCYLELKQYGYLLVKYYQSWITEL